MGVCAPEAAKSHGRFPIGLGIRGVGDEPGVTRVTNLSGGRKPDPQTVNNPRTTEAFVWIVGLPGQVSLFEAQIVR